MWISQPLKVPNSLNTIIGVIRANADHPTHSSFPKKGSLQITLLLPLSDLMWMKLWCESFILASELTVRTACLGLIGHCARKLWRLCKIFKTETWGAVFIVNSRCHYWVHHSYANTTRVTAFPSFFKFQVCHMWRNLSSKNLELHDRLKL